MLELPETYTFSKQLNDRLAGKQLAAGTLQASPHKFAFFTEEVDYSSVLEKQIISKVYPVAAYITIEFSGGSRLLFRDGIRFYLADSENNLPKKHQLLLAFSDGTFLACSVAMYGAMMFYPDEKEQTDIYYRAAAEKPVPYDAVFDFSYYQSLIPENPKKMSLKAFLGTEQRIPGLGNGCLHDIFFVAGMRPRRQLASLNETEHRTLYKSVVQTLTKMKDGGGRDTEKDIYGQPGGYQTILSKNTYKSGCKVCGADIVKENFLGGTIYYCPECQC